MVSIDTNVAVRLLVNDDPVQTKLASALFAKESIYISKTVVLETEWVLRGAYKLERKRVNSAIRALLSLEQVIVEGETELFFALDAHAKGLDFADALHLASSRRSDRFATFDSSLRTKSIKLGLLPPVTVP